MIAAEPPFLNLSIDPASPRHVEKVVNDASQLVRVAHLLVPPEDRLPASNGTLGNLITLDTAGIAALHPANKTITVRVITPSATESDPTVAHTATLDFGAAGSTTNPPPTTPKALRGKLEAAIQTANDGNNATHPLLAGATVQLIETAAGYRFLVEPNRRAREFAPGLVVTVGNATGSTAATSLGFTGGGSSENVQDYVLGITGAVVSQAAGTAGADGTLPDATALKGAPGDPPTGMYALTKVDLFNLLCIPRAANLTDAQADALIGDALTFCEEHRAMLLIDIPADRNTVQEIKDWIDDNASYRHKNSVVYFPRIKVADPLDDFRLRSIGAAGTMAGSIARTDATRGVWKAPAGIEATLRGVAELDFKLTDPRERRRSTRSPSTPAHVPDPRQVVLGRAHARRGRRRSPRSGSTSRSAASR